MAKTASEISIIAVSVALKASFDNRYGTGQSTLDPIIRATNVLLREEMWLLPARMVRSRCTAMRAKGMGARTIIVTEIDHLKAVRR